MTKHTSYMFRYQDSIIREFISNIFLWVRQLFQALIAHTAIIEVKILKIPIQITQPHCYQFTQFCTTPFHKHMYTLREF